MFFKKIKYDQSTDEQLMQAVVKGKEAAFNQLFDRYHKPLLHFFYRLLYQDQNKAEDFVQNLFMKIIERPEAFDPTRSFRTWVYTVARNMCKNEYRYKASRQHLHHALLETDLHHQIDENDEQQDMQRFLQELQRALQEISEDHREVFVLRYQDGFSVLEISEILECPEGTVKSRLHYALKKLGRELSFFRRAN